MHVMQHTLHVLKLTRNLLKFAKLKYFLDLERIQTKMKLGFSVRLIDQCISGRNIWTRKHARALYHTYCITHNFVKPFYNPLHCVFCLGAYDSNNGEMNPGTVWKGGGEGESRSHSESRRRTLNTLENDGKERRILM